MSYRKPKTQREKDNGKGKKSPELIAKNAVREKDVLRKDCQTAMRKICPDGWSFDEAKARQLMVDEAGYYQDAKQSQAGYVLDPDDANDLFVYHNYKSNRKFDQAHSTNLSNSIKVAVAIDIAVGPSNFPVIVNGQHTLWAIFMRGIPTQVSITIYQCRDDAAIARCFAIFDSNKKRTLANSIDAAKMGGLELNITSVRHQRWTNAVATAENGFSAPKSRETNAEKMERATRTEVILFAEWIENLLEKGGQAKLISQGAAAAFYSMYASDQGRATEFVKKFLTGHGIVGDDDPVGRIRNRLVINKPEAEHGSSAANLHAGMVYTAWRAFCLDRPLRQLRKTEDIPLPDRWKVFASAHDACEAVA